MRIMQKKKARDHHIQTSCNALESLHITLKRLKERLPGHNFPCSCKDYQEGFCAWQLLKVCSVHLLYFDSYWLKNSSCKIICCCSKLPKASESQPNLSSLEKINHNCKNFDSCILCLHLGVCYRCGPWLGDICFVASCVSGLESFISSLPSDIKKMSSWRWL